MRAASEGILYPKDALSVLKASFCASSSDASRVTEVPHASWQVCRAELDKAFSAGCSTLCDRVFVLAPLHKGKIGYDDSFTLYVPEDGELCGSDWRIELSTPSELRTLVTVSDDVCSEEHSLEVLAPYLALRYPNIPVTYVLAPESDPGIRTFVKILDRNFPNARILISNNRSTNCANMWKEAIAP